MNIQQLEYVIAVDNFRHFAKAAAICCVTQPTLSMMIQRLEEELDAKVFDRSKHPVEPTLIGKQIIEQARISLKSFKLIKEIVDNEHNSIKGSFQLGIIPTIASYLVPEIISRQQRNENGMELILKENTTNNAIREILNGSLDGGLMAGPLHHPDLVEYPVYYEKFYAYVSPRDAAYQDKEIDLDEIDINRIWLLENEHCLRGQIERLCRMKEENAGLPVKYASGSIDTLIHIVDYNDGLTIIPEMHAMGLCEEQQDHLRTFKNRTAVRQVCLAVSKDYVRKTMLDKILELIRESVPQSMQNPELEKYIVDLA